MSTEKPTPGYVRPLGLFGILATELDMRKLCSEIDGLRGQIRESEREMLAGYLRRGTMIMALMEFTHDIFDEQFGTSGGSGIQTDGLFYWRCDTADYVERYGIGLPREFLESARQRAWATQPLSVEKEREIWQYLQTSIQRPPWKKILT